MYVCACICIAFSKLKCFFVRKKPISISPLPNESFIPLPPLKFSNTPISTPFLLCISNPLPPTLPIDYIITLLPSSPFPSSYFCPTKIVKFLNLRLSTIKIHVQCGTCLYMCVTFLSSAELVKKWVLSTLNASSVLKSLKYGCSKHVKCGTC